MLKADFHTHSIEDALDVPAISYSAKDLIRYAAKKRFEVLSITHHERVYFSNSLRSFAKKRGILLIPGGEARIEGAHVLVINTNQEELDSLKRFKDLERVKDKSLVIAPHPFFITHHCLGNNLEKNINLFHAVEFCHFYTGFTNNKVMKFVDGNTPAVRIARKYHKPIVGTSDVHKLYEFGPTHTLVDADKNVDSVLEAVKRNKIELVTRPMTTGNFVRRMGAALMQEMIYHDLLGFGKVKVPDKSPVK